MITYIYPKLFLEIANQFYSLSSDQNINENHTILLKRLSSNLSLLAYCSTSNIMLNKSSYFNPIKDDCLMLKEINHSIVSNLSNQTLILLENFDKELASLAS